MSNEPTTLGSYRFHTDVEDAVNQLRRAGIETQQMSIVGKDHHGDEAAIGLYDTGSSLVFWGRLGAFWASLSELLVGKALFVIPGVGHVFAMGPVVGAIVTALEGTAIGEAAGIVPSALLAVGVPGGMVATYAQRIAAGEIVLVVHGAKEQLPKAEDILRRTGASAAEARS